MYGESIITDNSSFAFSTGHGTLCKVDTMSGGRVPAIISSLMAIFVLRGYVQRYDNANRRYVTCLRAPTDSSRGVTYFLKVAWGWNSSGCGGVRDYYYAHTLSQIRDIAPGNIGGYFSGYVRSNHFGGNGLLLN